MTAPERRPRRTVLGLRPRRQREADPVAGARRVDAHEEKTAPGRDAQLGPGTERFAQPLLERLEERTRRLRLP